MQAVKDPGCGHEEAMIRMVNEWQLPLLCLCYIPCGINTCYRAETNVRTGEVRSVEQFSFVSPGQDLENDIKWY